MSLHLHYNLSDDMIAFTSSFASIPPRKSAEDYPQATEEEASAAYEEYKDFFRKYHSDHPGQSTDCYEEYLETKQERQLGVIGWGRTVCRRDITGFVAVIWRENALRRALEECRIELSKGGADS
ncbi:7932_t:CDS:2 [Paraglomus occultum]|uniref:7932_t:CDS:1 n=1 Tax=Paraglomus occultum TaxID=144539 RepID=A0A9N8ZQ96_9GLOM|nr:7932_t:CDS:2 [Paraglomus occultum]